MTIPTGRSCTLLGYLNDGWLHQNLPSMSSHLDNAKGRGLSPFDLKRYVYLDRVANGIIYLAAPALKVVQAGRDFHPRKVERDGPAQTGIGIRSAIGTKQGQHPCLLRLVQKETGQTESK